MLERIKRCFFNHALANAIKRGIVTKLPDRRINTITILIDRSQLIEFDSIKKVLIQNFDFQQVKIIVFETSKAEPIEDIFIDLRLTKHDFNFFGGVKREKLNQLKQSTSDLFVSLVENNNVYTDRIMLEVVSSFKVAFSTEVQCFTSLTIDVGGVKSTARKLELLSNYLDAFNGNS